MYTNIVIYETQFQKRIVETLLNQRIIANNNLLIIDATDHKLKINNEEFNFNLNKITKLFKSIKSLSLLNNKKLECEFLYSTHFTGINAIFFSSYIKCKKKVLIDDGIGTPVLLLDNNVYNRLFTFQIRFLIIAIALFVTNHIILSSIKKTINSVDYYYSSYNIEKLLNLETLRYLYIEGIHRKYYIQKNIVGIIGAPMIDFGLINKKKFRILLKTIVEDFGKINYFLHPDENKVLELSISEVTFIKPKNSIEDYFEQHGVPEILFSFSSSAALNIASSNPSVKIFNISYKSFFRNKSHIYSKVLKELNISESKYCI